MTGKRSHKQVLDGWSLKLCHTVRQSRGEVGMYRQHRFHVANANWKDGALSCKHSWDWPMGARTSPYREKGTFCDHGETCTNVLDICEVNFHLTVWTFAWIGSSNWCKNINQIMWFCKQTGATFHTLRYPAVKSTLFSQTHVRVGWGGRGGWGVPSRKTQYGDKNTASHCIH